MYRNTLLLVSVLAVCAALLIGVNIGKRMSKQAPSPTPNATPTPTPGPVAQTYMDTYCGFSLTYPASYTVLENASGSAILNNTADKTKSITLTCQKAIPRPALTADKIETLTIPTAMGASISATLYHDSSAKDGTPIDVVIFKHPTNGMDAFVAGYGTAFNDAIKTLRILP
jgi:hypothetical protein